MTTNSNTVEFNARTIERQIRSTRAACRQLRKPKSQFEAQRFVRMSERLARLYVFRSWMQAKKYAA